MNVLVTGTSGAGKSTQCASLLSLGYQAIDMDKHISAWHDWDNNEIQPPEIHTPAFRKAHKWLWNETKLKHFLGNPNDTLTFFCGNAAQQEDHYPKFDKIIFLHAPNNIIKERLLTREHNPYGKDPEELKGALDWNQHIRNNLEKQGYILIDTNNPIKTVTQEIIKSCS